MAYINRRERNTSDFKYKIKYKEIILAKVLNFR